MSYVDFARFEGIDERTIHYRLTRGLTRIDTGSRGRNGKPIWAIPISELTPAARQRWETEQGTRQARPSPGEGRSLPAPARAEAQTHSPATCSSSSASNLATAGPGRLGSGAGMLPGTEPAPYKKEHVSPDGLSAFNDVGIPVLKSDPHIVWQAGLAAAWSPHAVAEFEFRRRAVVTYAIALAGCRYGDKGEILRQVAADHGVRDFRLRIWHAAWERHGEPALVPKWKKDRGPKLIPKPLQAWLEANYAQGGGPSQPNKPTIRQCERLAWDWIADHYNRTGQVIRVPSYSAIRAFIQSIVAQRPMLVLSAREGPKHARDRFGAHVIRHPEAIPLGDLWVLDHRVADVHVIDHQGRIRRPWISAIEEEHSGDLVGWTIRDKPSSESVASAYRRAMLGFYILDPATGEILDFPARGKPKFTITDGGREFRGGVFADPFNPKMIKLDPAISATVHGELGIQNTKALPRSARSKPIEALFSSLATRTENFFPGYCGRSTDDKPEQLEERRKRGQLLTWDQFIIAFARSIVAWRSERPLGHYRHLPPIAYWADHPIDPVDPARLDSLLVRKEAKTIRGGGIEIQHGPDRFHYASDDVEFAMLSGAKVAVLWSGDDPDFAIAVTPTGRRLLLLRVDLLGKSFDLLLGREMPAEHKLMKRVGSAQAALIASYREFGAAHRNAQLSDRFSILSQADANGVQIRTRAREIQRDAAPKRPVPSASDRSDPSDRSDSPDDEPSRVLSDAGAAIANRIREESANA